MNHYFDADYSYSCGTFTDPRNNKEYELACIGDQTWFAENLNYNTGNSWCYDNDSENCKSLGRLYDWQTAQSACPDGWHLPSEEEWLVLANTLGGTDVAGGKLKGLTGWNEPNVGASNSSGWSAFGSGIYIQKGEHTQSHGFMDKGEMAYFWSSTESTGYAGPTAVGLSLRRSGKSMSLPPSLMKSNGQSCRCVKDN
ncbi:MAG: FISUMP domain-containing protein [Balneolaceae bacterium]|nr:FISUMP domain-containing protein [Balneolaceae bacterium]